MSHSDLLGLPPAADFAETAAIEGPGHWHMESVVRLTCQNGHDVAEMWLGCDNKTRWWPNSDDNTAVRVGSPNISTRAARDGTETLLQRRKRERIETERLTGTTTIPGLFGTGTLPATPQPVTLSCQAVGCTYAVRMSRQITKVQALLEMLSEQGGVLRVLSAVRTSSLVEHPSGAPCITIPLDRLASM